MTNYRPVPEITFKVRPKPAGEVGRFITAPIAGLVVDGRYQRVFQPKNESRVRDLATHWNWGLYTPIILADLGSGKYAIIDGQHRAAAALSIGINELPAWVTRADEVEQAKAFLAINASPTRVDSLQLWHSRHAAGDYDAVMLWDVCKRAGVEISRYPVAAAFRQPHITLCPGVLHSLRESVGNELLLRALLIVVKVGQKQKASLITRQILRAVTRLAGAAWKDIEVDDIATGLSQVDFQKAVAVAAVEARENDQSTTDCLCTAISASLLQALEAA